MGMDTSRGNIQTIIQQYSIATAHHTRWLLIKHGCSFNLKQTGPLKKLDNECYILLLILLRGTSAL